MDTTHVAALDFAVALVEREVSDFQEHNDNWDDMDDYVMACRQEIARIQEVRNHLVALRPGG